MTVNVIKKTITAAAAGDYAANDVLSNSASNNAGVASSFFLPSQHCYIVGATMRCSEDSVAFRPRLHLFNYNPAAADVEMDDNAAFAINNATGSAGYLGYIDLPAFADMGTLPAFTQVANVNKPIALNGVQTIYGVLQTLDAETNETASMTIDIDLFVES